MREAKWAVAVVASLIIIAGLTFVGSWLLRFDWFEALFRIPHEAVLVPFWTAVLSAPIIALAVLSLWLLIALLPAIESSIIVFLVAHIIVLIPCWGFSALFIPDLGGPLALVLSSFVITVPRLAFPTLRPPRRRAA